MRAVYKHIKGVNTVYELKGGEKLFQLKDNVGTRTNQYNWPLIQLD